jgi:glycosyltransferase involved in cell wall biosynthesis
MSVVDRSSKRLRVLLVGPLPPPFGGIPTYVRDLRDSGMDDVEFRVFNTALPASVAPSNREGARHYQSLRENGMWVAVKMVLYVLFSYPRLLLRLLWERPHMVHVFTCSYFGYWRNWFYVLLAKACGRKTIFHLLNAIDVFYGEVNPRQQRWIRKSLNSADLYLVQSPELQKWVEQYSRRRVLGIWNGIHLDRIPAKGDRPSRKAFGKAPVGITVGVLGRNKGTYDILDALELLKCKGIDVAWVFVGGGDVEGFTERAKAKGLGDRVLFAGRVDETEKWQHLLHADFFCLPSCAEGQPISILEAMAVGLPVISTAVGSIPEVILDGESGIVIKHGDSATLASAIARMSSDASLRGRMGTKALELIRARHDIQVLFRKLGRLFAELLEDCQA